MVHSHHKNWTCSLQMPNRFESDALSIWARQAFKNVYSPHSIDKNSKEPNLEYSDFFFLHTKIWNLHHSQPWGLNLQPSDSHAPQQNPNNILMLYLMEGRVKIGRTIWWFSSFFFVDSERRSLDSVQRTEWGWGWIRKQPWVLSATYFVRYGLCQAKPNTEVELNAEGASHWGS